MLSNEIKYKIQATFFGHPFIALLLTSESVYITEGKF